MLNYLQELENNYKKGLYLAAFFIFLRKSWAKRL